VKEIDADLLKMVYSNILPTSGAPCVMCSVGCGELGLKCSKCKMFAHPQCTGFPSYYLLHYFNSRISYTCEKCVRGDFGDKFEERIGDLKNRMGAVASAGCGVGGGALGPECSPGLSVSPGAAAAVASSGERSSCSPDAVSEDSRVPAVPSGSDSSQAGVVSVAVSTGALGSEGKPLREKGVCRKFLQRACRHGRAGIGCAFAHPKLCIRYCKFGKNSTKGCKRGKECNFFHPPLCWRFADGGVCERADKCKYYHISSPAREPVLRPGQEQPGVAVRGAPRSGGGLAEPAGVGVPGGLAPAAPQVNANHFLELQVQMRSMQLQMEKLMSLADGPQWRSVPGKRCSCR
jgi:hypothetical protein